MVLRMEDLDLSVQAAYLPQLAQDLLWLGLDWDTGWQPGDTEYTQSHRTAVYQTAFHRLEEQGLVYPCFCTRKELLAASAPHASVGARVYDGRCRLSQRRRPSGPAAGPRPGGSRCRRRRFRRVAIGPKAQWLTDQDFILRRSDGVYAYQLAVAADDGAMGITRVVRGWDLLSSTPRQIWLLEQLGYPVPAYCHVPLLLAPDGRRLSKRDRDLDVVYLQAHSTPEKVTGLLAWLAGLQPRPEPVQPRELIGDFAWTKVGAQDKVVDEAAWQALLLELLSEELDGLFPAETCTWLTPRIFAVLSWVSPL